MFHLNYRYNTAHWLRFTRIVNRRVFAKYIWLGSLIFPALALASYLRLTTCEVCHVDSDSWLFGVMTGTLAYFATTFAAHTFGKRKALKPDGVFLGPRNLVADDVKVEISGKHDKTTYAWQALDSVSVDKVIVVLWTDPAAGIVIPRTAFASASDEQAFVKFARARILATRIEGSSPIATRA